MKIQLPNKINIIADIILKKAGKKDGTVKISDNSQSKLLDKDENNCKRIKIQQEPNPDSTRMDVTNAGEKKTVNIADFKYEANEIGPYSIYIESTDKNNGSLSNLRVGKPLHSNKNYNPDIIEKRGEHLANASNVNFRARVCLEFLRQKRIKEIIGERNISFFEAANMLAPKNKGDKGEEKSKYQFNINNYPLLPENKNFSNPSFSQRDRASPKANFLQNYNKIVRKNQEESVKSTPAIIRNDYRTPKRGYDEKHNDCLIFQDRHIRDPSPRATCYNFNLGSPPPEELTREKMREDINSLLKKFPDIFLELIKEFIPKHNDITFSDEEPTLWYKGQY
ncbi:hypothetical protein JTB14_023077 [Gonioctena quinquepunctata]|nr:hypothetical protein JTB14_023077 [Gonioctena quinquepunctata]